MEKRAKLILGIAAVVVTAAAAAYIGRLWQTREVGPAAEASEPSNQPLRIVSMAPNLTEILFALGLGEHIVAVSSDSDTPPAAQNLPSVGTFWQPDLEAVIAKRPTLVVTLGFGQQTQMADKLRSVGIGTLTVNIESIDELTAAIETIGEATGQAEAARMLVENMQEQIRQIRERYAGRDRPRVMWVIQRSPLRVAGTKTFVNEMLEIVGAQNAIRPTLHQYPPIDVEQIFSARPDIIIEAVEDLDDPESQLEETRKHYGRYTRIPAIQKDRIYLVEADLASRLGPRLPGGLRLIAEKIWGEEPRS